MHVPITTATLALLTFAILLLRIYWLRVPTTTRFYLLRAAVVLIVIHVLFTVTKWSTSSDHVNVLIKWLAIASYELLVMLFTRLSPRWLTSICAVILLVPIFASSVLLPLTYLFDTTTNEPTSLGSNLFYSRFHWGDDPSANSGADIIVYSRPHLAPFLRHDLQHVSFNNQQCNAGAAFAVLGADPKTILARCPHWPAQGPGTEDRLLPLP
jgi:uncharacterized membrane protein YwzB